MSLTPLIDVIFLLLLFFMLSSTFSRFADVPLVQAGGGATTEREPQTPLFFRLAPDGLTLNGQPIALAELQAAVPQANNEIARTGLLSVGDEVSSQAFVDTLVAMQAVASLSVQVLR